MPGTLTFTRQPPLARMRSSHWHHVALAAALALTACGTTTSLRYGADIADAGKAYSVAIQSVADLAIDKHVDWVANGAIKTREPAAITGRQLGTALDLDIKGSREFVHQVVIFKAHAQRLGDYFDALGKLVNADVKQPYIDSAKELAGSVDTLGKALQAVGVAKDIHVTDAQQTAAGALAGTVATAIHGEKVAEVLRRDADLIDAEIALQGAALEFFKAKVAWADQLALDRLYVEKVRAPYAQDAVQGSRPQLPADWKDNLAIALKDVQIETQIAKAQSAADKLRNAWRAFLAGKGNASDVLGDVTLLRDTAEQLQTLHANRH
jgi:hypothetical protein